MTARQLKGMVAVGSINLDRFCEVPTLPTAGVTIAATSLRTSTGGKGANQAVAAARLNAPVRILGAVGGDATGARLRQELEQQGVRTDGIVERRNVPTGEAFIFVDPAAENSIVVVAGANGTLTDHDVPDEAFIHCETVTLSFEIPLETVVHAAKLARKHQASVILNPSPYRDIPPELLRNVSVLVLNEHELQAIARRPLTAQTTVEQALRELEVPHAVVTLGSQGAMSRDEHGRVRRHKAPRVHPVDTTGCGDAFLGALATAILEGLSFERAVDLAVVVGSLTATKHGAQPSYPTRAEVAAFAELNDLPAFNT
jgi:ribokinase